MRAIGARAASRYAMPAGRGRPRWARRSPWTRRRSQRWPPGSGASGPAGGERLGLVDILGKVDLLPFLAADRDGADFRARPRQRVDRAKVPTAGTLGRAHHPLDLIDEEAGALAAKGEQADRFRIIA